VEELSCPPSSEATIHDKGLVAIRIPFDSRQQMQKTIYTEPPHGCRNRQPGRSDFVHQEEPVIPLILVERHEKQARSGSPDPAASGASDLLPGANRLEAAEAGIHLEGISVGDTVPVAHLDDPGRAVGLPT
jgi:hypothetical protein